MGKIKLLSESLIGKIAAGEVVERPAAALKELIENSMDAGASAISAEIRDGGLTYIRVTDNGSGIDESDIRMAFERHATSKIAREQDLYAISTLGFRGEALASIAAVSKVTLTTRTSGRDTGLKVMNEGGKIISITETACPVGTTIIVSDLFFNTPVRRGFMKKASAEGSAVTELLSQLILSRPDISFRYLNGGKTIFHSPGDGQLSSAIHTVFGGATLKTMREVKGHMNGILLNGYVGIGENARGNRGHEMFFINGRMMHSNILSSALETACRERVMIGKFPICALHLQIPYETVDVNVHPNKLEVRFRDEASISEAVTTLIIESLKERDAFEKPVEMKLNRDNNEKGATDQFPNANLQFLRESAAKVTVTSVLPEIARDYKDTDQVKYTPIYSISETMNSPGKRETEIHSLQSAAKSPIIPDHHVVSGNEGKDLLPLDQSKGKKPEVSVVPGERDTSQQPVNKAKSDEKCEQINTIIPGIKKDLKIFGALFHTYIMIEYDDQLLLIDQHAVHERLLFDRLMSEHAGKCAAQELFIPIIISLTDKEALLMEENRELLESIGLIMDRFGEHEAAIRSIPMILGETETTSFVRDVMADLEAGRGLTFDKQRSDLLQTACKHAVKGGEALTEDQLRNLAEEMIEKKVTPTCPHGRPLVVTISHRELDRKFKRIQ